MFRKKLYFDLVVFCAVASCSFLSGSKKYNLVSGMPDIYITDATELIGETWNNGTVWDKPLIEVFYKELKESNGSFVFLDIGAQTGSFTLLSKYFPNSQWYAFEPIVEATNELKKNLLLNEIKNVSVHQLGVSDCSGWRNLKLPKN